MSAYSLKALAEAFAPLMTNGGAFVGLDFDNTVAWPAYNWMGVAKSALESVSRYLARDLGPRGIRSNLVAAGPVKTIAAKSIPGFKRFEDVWDDRARSAGTSPTSSAVAKACVAPVVRLVPGHHRRDHPCRRRLPRRRRLTKGSTMKRLLTAALAATTLFALAACSDDDDNKSGLPGVVDDGSGATVDIGGALTVPNLPGIEDSCLALSRRWVPPEPRPAGRATRLSGRRR